MANSLTNWFKNKIIFTNNSLPAINGNNLNKMQENIESDMSAFIQGDLKNQIESLIAGAKTSGMPVGSGCDFFGTVAPQDHMFADGTAISRTEYAALFAVIGTTYGEGDGETTFNLPDKREQVSVMYKEGSTNFGELGAKVGSNSTTLVADNLPPQSGSFSFHDSSLGSVVHTVSGVFAGSDVKQNTYKKGGGQEMGANSYSTIKYNNGGKSTPISNIQQSLVCNYIIKVK